MKKIAIILTQGFADWEYAFLAGTGVPFYGLDIQFFAPEAGTVRSQGNLAATVSGTTDAIAEWAPDIITVIGGTIWLTDNAPDVNKILQEHHANGGVVAGICGGTVALARAGLLNTVTHTANEPALLLEHAEEYCGAEFFCNSSQAICENNIITASGTAPVSFTAAIFKTAGLDSETVLQFTQMLAAEHT